MRTTAKDRRDHELLRYLKEDKVFCSDRESNELRKKFKIGIPELHSAIRLTSSVHGSADCSRSAYRHHYRSRMERKMKRITLKELTSELNGINDD